MSCAEYDCRVGEFKSTNINPILQYLGKVGFLVWIFKRGSKEISLYYVAACLDFIRTCIDNLLLLKNQPNYRVY